MFLKGLLVLAAADPSSPMVVRKVSFRRTFALELLNRGLAKAEPAPPPLSATVGGMASQLVISQLYAKCPKAKVI